MNDKTVQLLECYAAMQTTKKVAQHYDKVIEEVSNINSSEEVIAAVLIAAIRCGVMKFTLLDIKQ